MNKKTSLGLVVASGVAAIATHAYLFNFHIKLKYGLGISSTALCNLNAQFSCEAASASAFSELFGVPMAMWGLLANVAMVIFAAFYWMSEEERVQQRRLAALLITIGSIVIATLVMGVLSLLYLTSYCPFCIATYLFSFVSLWGGIKLYSLQTQPSLGFSEPGTFQILGYTAVPLFIMGFVITHRFSPDTKDLEPMVRASLDRWKASAPKAINTLDPIIMGASKSEAKFTIVEFADFRCGHCKDAFPTIKAFVKSHPDARLEFQTFALDGECNKQMTRADGGGCILARLVFCAEKLARKGLEMKAHVFDNQKQLFTVDNVKSRMDAFAAVAGIGKAELMACIDDEAMKKLISAQADLGAEIGVNATPTVFVNGKKLELGHLLPVLQKAYLNK